MTLIDICKRSTPKDILISAQRELDHLASSPLIVLSPFLLNLKILYGEFVPFSWRAVQESKTDVYLNTSSSWRGGRLVENAEMIKATYVIVVRTRGHTIPKVRLVTIWTTIKKDVYFSISHPFLLILREVFNPYLYGNIPLRSTFSSVTFPFWLWRVLCFSSLGSLSFRISGRDSF